MNELVLIFIKQFNEAKELFLNGCCYWFAFILKGRFGGTLFYNPIQNHFATMIAGRLYDASGEISGDGFESWKSFRNKDDLETARIVRDCIDKKML